VSDRVEIKTAGFEEAIRALGGLPDRVQKRVIVGAIRAGAVIVRAAAKNTAPIRTSGGAKRMGRRDVRLRSPGFLRRRLIYRKQRGRAAYRIGPAREAFYGAFLETGTGRIAARPWMAPAWESSKRAALEATAQRFRELIAKELGRGLR